MYANGLVNLFIVRIHSCVMSFILFTSEYIQNVDQVCFPSVKWERSCIYYIIFQM